MPKNLVNAPVKLVRVEGEPLPDCILGVWAKPLPEPPPQEARLFTLSLKKMPRPPIPEHLLNSGSFGGECKLFRGFCAHLEGRGQRFSVLQGPECFIPFYYFRGKPGETAVLRPVARSKIFKDFPCLFVEVRAKLPFSALGARQKVCAVSCEEDKTKGPPGRIDLRCQNGAEVWPRTLSRTDCEIPSSRAT